MQCYCDSQKELHECCEPFLQNRAKPATPTELMRSRYTAYVLGNGEYLVRTTTRENRYEDDAKLIAEFSQSVVWLGLKVIYSHADIVEFKAYYKDKEGIKLQHEKSYFVQEEGEWLYESGELYAAKVERNELCPCGSGKKYKKCCGR